MKKVIIIILAIILVIGIVSIVSNKNAEEPKNVVQNNSEKINSDGSISAPSSTVSNPTVLGEDAMENRLDTNDEITNTIIGNSTFTEYKIP